MGCINKFQLPGGKLPFPGSACPDGSALRATTFQTRADYKHVSDPAYARHRQSILITWEGDGPNAPTIPSQPNPPHSHLPSPFSRSTDLIRRIDDFNMILRGYVNSQDELSRNGCNNTTRSKRYRIDPTPLLCGCIAGHTPRFGLSSVAGPPPILVDLLGGFFFDYIAAGRHIGIEGRNLAPREG